MKADLEKLKKETYRAPRIAFNWDGDDGVRWITWPVTREQFAQMVVGQYAGTDIDTIQWSPGDGATLFTHAAKHGAIWGEHAATYPAVVWTGADNGRRLREEGGEVAIISEACRQHGMRFYVSLRMNDTHDQMYSALWSPLKEAHPEWLIGKRNPEAKDMSKWEECTGMNYAVEAVRAYRLEVIREFVEDYDIDGLQLDFSTFPPYFRQGEEKAGLAAMNDFMRRARGIVEEVARKRGRYIAFNAVVVDALEDNVAIGLDVPTWLAEGLLDEVVGGRSYVRFYPLTDLIEVAREHGVKVYGGTNHEQPHLCDRAWAMLHWETGVDGLQLYNYYYDHERVRTTGDFIVYETGENAAKPFFHEIGSREKLRYLDKTYKAVAGVGYTHPWMIGGFPGVQVPVELREGKPVRVEIYSYDDVEEAARRGRLKEIRFRLTMSWPAPLDAFRALVNGHEASGVEFMRSGNNFKGIQFVERAENMRKGKNEVEVELVRRTPRVVAGAMWATDPELNLTDVALDITYQSGAPSVSS